MERNICVFAASGMPHPHVYYHEAGELGGELARRGYGLCYGAGTLGLMGAAARAVRAAGGRVLGVIPEALHRPGITYEECDELIVTQTMRQRKQVMDDRSMAFVALPGGFGTLEELLEAITLKQLRYHNKPIVLLNILGYFDALAEQFERAIGEGMADASARALYYMAPDAAQALDYIDGYTPASVADKLPVKHNL